MPDAGAGRVVNISMNHTTMNRRGFVPYGPSRAGAEALSRIMAADLADTPVRVNTLLPGVIETDRTVNLSRLGAERQKISIEEAVRRTAQSIPVGRIGTAAEFGAVAAFLASPLAAYVTGSLIRIDGGSLRSV